MELIRIFSTRDEHWPDVVDLYTASFPERERRNVNTLEIVLTDRRFHAVKFVINNGFAALMFYWQLDNLVFLEHFAVTENNQGKSYGKQMMEWLLKLPATHFLLEVEHPFDDNSQRRIAFYERLGFSANHYEYFHPSDKQDRALETITSAGLDVAKTRDLLMRVTQSLAAAIFDKTECTTCPFNSASQRALFETHVDDGHCTNPGCFQLKTEAADAARGAVPTPPPAPADAPKEGACRICGCMTSRTW